MNCLTAALQWLDMGFTPIPHVYRSKTPLVKWGQWVNTLPSSDMVRGWFSGLRNLGIVLGKGLTILDFDDLDAYAEWTGPLTYAVRSNRGVHVYYWIDEPTCTAPMIGGEVLSTGHLITVPPSVHESGRQYTPINNLPITRLATLAETGVRFHVLEAKENREKPVAPGTGLLWLPTQGSGYAGNESPVTRIKNHIKIGSVLLGYDPGKSFMMTCPFHSDSKPSLAVYHDTNRAKCFAVGCPASRGIDVIDAVALRYHLPLNDAIKLLASNLP